VKRRDPRPLSAALGDLQSQLAPATLLGEVQRLWPEIAGPALAGHAEPTGERDGVIGFECDSGSWAHELTLMAGTLVTRFEGALGGSRHEGRLAGFRFTAAGRPQATARTRRRNLR